jgi:hypothetical protein
MLVAEEVRREVSMDLAAAWEYLLQHFVILLLLC